MLILKPDAFTVQLALSRLSTFYATDQGLTFADMAIAILAHLARKLGGTVAIIDRDLFGGSCPFWACMPSKALLHAAAIHALGGDYPWQRAFDPAELFADPRRSDSICR